MALLAEIIGVIGVALILYAYFALQSSRMSPSQPRFHLINFLGAMAVIFSLIYDWNLAQFVLEAVWAALSVLGLVICLRRRQPAEDSHGN